MLVIKFIAFKHCANQLRHTALKACSLREEEILLIMNILFQDFSASNSHQSNLGLYWSIPVDKLGGEKHSVYTAFEALAQIDLCWRIKECLPILN